MKVSQQKRGFGHADAKIKDGKGSTKEARTHCEVLRTGGAFEERGRRKKTEAKEPRVLLPMILREPVRTEDGMLRGMDQ